MNKFGILRAINHKLKYRLIEKYIDFEVAIDISQKPDFMIKEIKTLIEENLDIKLGKFKGNSIEGTIAKYGLIDVNFEVGINIDKDSKNGFQILRDNGWIDSVASDEYEEGDFVFLLEDMVVTELKENQTYIKVYAVSEDLSHRSLEQKSYLLKQMIKKTGLKPLSEDKIQIFRIQDMCYTNYSGIWLWKYFYM